MELLSFNKVTNDTVLLLRRHPGVLHQEANPLIMQKVLVQKHGTKAFGKSSTDTSRNRGARLGFDTKEDPTLATSKPGSQPTI